MVLRAFKDQIVLRVFPYDAPNFGVVFDALLAYLSPGTFPEMSQKTLVIVPTYNEPDNLRPLIQRLMAQAVSVIVLVAGDTSPNCTGQLADEIAATTPRIADLNRKEKDVLRRVFCAGFGWALQREYEFIFDMDGNVSPNP